MSPSERSLARICFTLLLGALPGTGEHRYQTQRRPQSAFLGAVNAVRLNVELRQAISDALGNEFNHAHMAVVKAELTPMWQSLAKDANDRVDVRSFRYALQRYMHKKYHLSIVGLELGVSVDTTSATIMSHAPEHVADMLHGNVMSATNFRIDDLVATIAMLEQLLAHSGSQLLGNIYDKFGFDPHEHLSREKVNQVLDSYLLRWLLNEDTLALKELEAKPHLRGVMLPIWPEIVHFGRGLADAFEYAHAADTRVSHQRHQWTPMRRWYSFADVSTVVGYLPFSYGEFWRDECDKVKDALLQLDYQSTGRVKLSDFHGAALGGEWRFGESKEYLRKLGALDESSRRHGPRVIIPNYLQGPSNCIVPDTRYRVCCHNDCEDHMAEIEEAVASPTATPEQLLQAISNIANNADGMGTVMALSLQSQLIQIAQLHQGLIPVHGRLFAQWLHYVFPRDCPFPHKAGTVSKLTPKQFGTGHVANKDEMRFHVEQDRSLDNETQHPAPSRDDWMTQWSQDEELVTVDFEMKAPWEGGANFIPRLIYIAMLCASALGVLGKAGIRSEAGSDKGGICFRPKAHLV